MPSFSNVFIFVRMNQIMNFPRALYGILGLFLFLPFSADAQTSISNRLILWGTDQGLYRRSQAGRAELLWSDGKVLKIIQIGNAAASGNNRNAGSTLWALLTDQGILVSGNLKDWEQRSEGLPEKVIKVYKDGEKSFISTVQEIKDLEIDRENPEFMVCAVKDGVYLSRNGGRKWESLGMPNFRSNGIKAVSVISPNGSGEEFTVLCAHSIYGVYYINPDKPGAKWNEMNTGLEKLETTDNPDEISDFVVVPSTGVFASQTFRRRIYQLDWEAKNWNLAWSDDSEFGAIDSFSAGKNTLRFVRNGGITEMTLTSANRQQTTNRQDLVTVIRSIPKDHKPNCAVFYENNSRTNSDIVNLSELWLLDEIDQGKKDTRPLAKAAGKEGIYLPVNHAMDPTSLKPYLEIIKERNLNMVVIDMKDDYGRLRFTPQNSSITNLGRVFRPVDLEEFQKTMKEQGIFTVARIVVFKDPEAAKKNGEKYAVWDRKNNKAWEGYYDTRRKKTSTPPEDNPALTTAILPDSDPDYEILRTWYDEKWVDPYSEEIWDYNASIAEELSNRGFDEIQFDYIRFPTDGLNLADARYRWQDTGMDMDSAILSFLRHVRSRVSAPISVDIYGANGWYRTGARTGQQVELLAPWVDVICPMYYPSHFEQQFLAHDPPELRPFRIYSQGTRRTYLIARGKVIVRPWAQAFFLNVSYDRKYYNADYVRLQLDGVRSAGSGGLTYWNNSGRYEDIPF